MKKRIIIRNTLIYSLLILGYIFLYVVDVDDLLHPNKENTVKSKIDFVYQQF
jgi:hypothetical protein